MPLRTPSLALSVLLFLAPAVVMADAPQAFITSKQATDYRTRLDSTRALFAAYQRLVAHRPGSESSVREFQTALTEAERLYFERHPDQAQELINKTYEQLKRGIESSVGPANPPLASAEAAQPSTSSTTAVRSRLESARALLTAYQRLRGEQSAGESLALRAESGLADADRQLQSGRVAEATRSIDDLYDLLKRAIESSVDPASQVRPTQAGGPDPARLAQDYHNRLDSVRTLLAAYQRIPGDPADTALRVQRVQASMAEAERLFFAEKLAEARARLDVIYDDIKRAIDARVAATPREANAARSASASSVAITTMCRPQ